MPKVKGRKQRKLRKETIALIIERYLEYMLMGEIASLDREQEQERMARAVVPSFEAELYQEAYSEVESLVGLAWLKMGEKRRRALAFLAMFPYEAGHRLARMMGMIRKDFKRLRSLKLG